MEKQYISYLLEQQKSRQLTEPEQAELKRLLTEKESENLLQSVIDQFIAEEHLPGDVDIEIQDASFNRIVGIDRLKTVEGSKSTNKTDPAPVRQMTYRRKWMWVAASVVLLFSIGAYLWNFTKDETQATIAENAETILPGREGAILTLEDGSSVVLDSLGNGLIAHQQGAKVVLQNGLLTYDPDEKAGGEIAYNTMTTPKGRQFQVVLPDGTKVWLNAASSLRYPTHFSGNERRVSITGEAYLEVTQQANQPFFVNVNNETEIQVLGTSFNINAYENEAGIKTTLVEGSVKVVPTINGIGTQSQILRKAGQQATVLRAPDAAVSTNSSADIEQVLAWKNGKFSFYRADIKTVMRELARWYNIEVEYQGETTKDLFGGDIQRNLPFDKVLDFLKQSQVHFEISGNKVIVMP